MVFGSPVDRAGLLAKGLWSGSRILEGKEFKEISVTESRLSGSSLGGLDDKDADGRSSTLDGGWRDIFGEESTGEPYGSEDKASSGSSSVCSIQDK